MRVAVIINPISGTRGHPEIARRRAELAHDVLLEHGASPEVFLTEGPGHATDLARLAINRGASIVVAWGGDGTVNEVASALVSSSAALGIVPSGSGNGLARELGLDRRPAEALAAALHARERLIDVGELGGRYFFNLAGIGFDALVAERFNAGPPGRRGLLPYVTITIRELWSYTPLDYTLTIDGQELHRRALLIVLANGTQFGNGMQIAPQAKVDDGRLDLVAFEGRSRVGNLWELRRLFNGTAPRAKGVLTRTVDRLIVSHDGPMLFHVDGEPVLGERALSARVHPGALRVRAA